MKKLLIVLILASLFVACDDDEKPTNWTRYEYLNEARDYIYFKRGTWWVYKKIPGGELDTIEVVKSSIDTTRLTGGGNTIIYEHLNWTGKSRLDGYEYMFYRPVPLPEPSWAPETGTLYRRYFFDRSRPGNYMGLTMAFFYPFELNQSLNGSTHITTLIGQNEEVIVDGISYTDVLTYDVTHDGTFVWDHLERSGGHVHYQWAPGIGVIKKEHMQKNISWVLVESHIVQ